MRGRGRAVTVRTPTDIVPCVALAVLPGGETREVHIIACERFVKLIGVPVGTPQPKGDNVALLLQEQDPIPVGTTIEVGLQ